MDTSTLESFPADGQAVDDHNDNLYTYCKCIKSMHFPGKEKLPLKKAVTQLSLDIRPSQYSVFLSTMLQGFNHSFMGFRDALVI